MFPEAMNSIKSQENFGKLAKEIDEENCLSMFVLMTGLLTVAFKNWSPESKCWICV